MGRAVPDRRGTAFRLAPPNRGASRPLASSIRRAWTYRAGSRYRTPAPGGVPVPRRRARVRRAARPSACTRRSTRNRRRRRPTLGRRGASRCCPRALSNETRVELKGEGQGQREGHRVRVPLSRAETALRAHPRRRRGRCFLLPELARVCVRGRGGDAVPQRRPHGVPAVHARREHARRSRSSTQRGSCRVEQNSESCDSVHSKAPLRRHGDVVRVEMDTRAVRRAAPRRRG